MFALPQSLDFISTTLDLVTARVYVPTDRFQTMNDIIAQITNSPRVPVKTCLSLLGHMTSCTHVAPFASLHCHCLQAWLQSLYSPDYHPVNFIVTILPRWFLPYCDEQILNRYVWASPVLPPLQTAPLPQAHLFLVGELTWSAKQHMAPGHPESPGCTSAFWSYEQSRRHARLVFHSSAPTTS